MGVMAKHPFYVQTTLQAFKVIDGPMPESPLELGEWRALRFAAGPFDWETRVHLTPLGRSPFAEGAWVMRFEAELSKLHPYADKALPHPSARHLAEALRKAGFWVYAKPLVVVDGSGGVVSIQDREGRMRPLHRMPWRGHQAGTS